MRSDRAVSALVCAIGALQVVSLDLIPAHAQKNNKDTPIVTVVDVMSGIGGVEKHLWLQVEKDGTLEWEDREQSGRNMPHSSKVPASQFAHLQEVLASTDWKEFRRRMGPYNVYKDTGVDLQFVISTRNGERRFSVGNPWPGSQIKPLPLQLKRVICVLESIRLQAEGKSQNNWCATG